MTRPPSKRTHIFRVIGQFVAKALLDSRIIDLSFNKMFLKLVLGEDLPLTVANLRVSTTSVHRTCADSSIAGRSRLGGIT